MGFRVIPCLLECYLLLVFWESSFGHLWLVLIFCVSLFGLVAGCLSYVLSARTLVGFLLTNHCSSAPAGDPYVLVLTADPERYGMTYIHMLSSDIKEMNVKKLTMKPKI